MHFSYGAAAAGAAAGAAGAAVLGAAGAAVLGAAAVAAVRERGDFGQGAAHPRPLYPVASL